MSAERVLPDQDDVALGPFERSDIEHMTSRRDNLIETLALYNYLLAVDPELWNEFIEEIGDDAHIALLAQFEEIDPTPPPPSYIELFLKTDRK